MTSGFLSQAARSGIARICGHRLRLLAGSDTCLVVAQFLVTQLLERALRHVHLASNLEHGRRGCKTLRDSSNGAHVGSDVFTGLSVTARCGLNEVATLEPQAQRQAVDFQLAHVSNALAAQSLTHTFAPGCEFVVIHCIVETCHGHSVRDGCERGGTWGTGDIEQRRRRHQLGVICFDRAKFAHQFVELGVGDLGVVVPEVTIVVESDQLPQFIGPSHDAFGCCHV